MRPASHPDRLPTVRRGDASLVDAAFRYAVDYPAARNRTGVFFGKLQQLRIVRKASA